MFLTASERIKNTSDYKKIKEVLERMDRTNMIWIGRGQCISMSDVICTALFQAGIKSRMLECQVVITNNNINPSQSVSVGYDSSYQEGQIDTHVVCVTETEIPMIIDASISYLLPENKKILIEEISNLNNRIICDVKKDGFELTYQQKTTNKVIFEHQRSILERIQTDNKIFKNLGILKILVILALSISAVNASRGLYDFYYRYISDEKLVGISANETILERLEVLEQKIKKLNTK
jgi:hypothetical protein